MAELATTGQKTSSLVPTKEECIEKLEEVYKLIKIGHCTRVYHKQIKQIDHYCLAGACAIVSGLKIAKIELIKKYQQLQDPSGRCVVSYKQEPFNTIIALIQWKAAELYGIFNVAMFNDETNKQTVLKAIKATIEDLQTSDTHYEKVLKNIR